MRRSLSLGLFLLLCACDRCGTVTPKGALLAQLPAHAQGTLWLPHPEVLGPKLTALSRLKLTTLPAQLLGYPDAESLWQGVIDQMGVDLRRPETLRELGLSPESGLGWVRLAPMEAGGKFHERGYLVLGVSQPGRLEQAILALAQKRLPSATAQRGSVKGLTLYGEVKAAPTLALFQKDGWAYVSAGRDVEKLPEWIVAQGPSLEFDPGAQASLGRLSATADAYLQLPQSHWENVPVGALAAAVTLEGDGLVAQLDLESGLQSGLADVLVPLSVPSGPEDDLRRSLPADAFLLARFKGNAIKLEPFLRAHLPASFLTGLESSGVHWGTLLAQVKPGAMLAASMAAAPPLSSGLPTLDVRSTNPFRFVELTGAAPLRDPAPVEEALANLPRAATAVGATAVRTAGPPGLRYLTTYAQGEGLSVAVSHGVLLAGGPHTRLDSAMQRLGASGSPALPPLYADRALTQALEQPTVAMALDARQLAKALKGLPGSTFGVGGFAIRAVLERWLDALSELRGATMGMSARGKAVDVELTVRWAAPPA